MASARIITDSSCELPADVVSMLGITVLPWRVRIGSEMIADSPALRTAEWYKELLTKKQSLNAAPPGQIEFAHAFERLASETDQIVAVLPSAKLAHSVTAANQARQAFLGRCTIHLLDSTFIGRSLGILVQQAAELAAQGLNGTDIVRSVSGMIPRSYLAVYVDSLSTMASRGLVDDRDDEIRGTPSYRPLLLIEDGQVVPLQRSRKRGAPAERIVEFVGEFRSLGQLCFVHNGQNPLMSEIRAAMAETRPNQPYEESIFGPVVASLMGVRALGVVAFEA